MKDDDVPPEINRITFPLPGLAGAMAQMFEGAGWDGVYFAEPVLWGGRRPGETTR